MSKYKKENGVYIREETEEEIKIKNLETENLELKQRLQTIENIELERQGLI